MQTSNTLETLLWIVAGLVTAGMTLVLAVGWFKGVFWEQQLKAKRKST